MIQEAYLQVVSGKAGGYGAPPTIDVAPTNSSTAPEPTGNSDTTDNEW
jgi:hypothetical protein